MESKSIVVYHGTNLTFEKVNLEKSKDKRDFGIGFYTTIIRTQAEEWAKRINLRYGDGRYVLEFEFEKNKALKIKEFEEVTKEWLEMVKENRLKGGLQHNYHVIIGPVADDNTMATIDLYVHGLLNAEAAMVQLKYAKPNNQVSLHTEKALKYLKFSRRYEL